MEELENEFRLLIGAYYGVQMMDGYDLKVYVLKDIQEEQKEIFKRTSITELRYRTGVSNHSKRETSKANCKML